MCGLCFVELDSRTGEREDDISCFSEVGVGEEYVQRGVVLATGASPWWVTWEWACGGWYLTGVESVHAGRLGCAFADLSGRPWRVAGEVRIFFVQSLVCCWTIFAWSQFMETRERSYMETRECSHVVGADAPCLPGRQLVHYLGCRNARMSTGRQRSSLCSAVV